MESTEKQGVSIVMPALNEARNIRKAALDAYAAGKASGVPFEILIVDDGSTDQTAAVVSELAKENPAVRLIRHEKNIGLGGCFMSGLKASRCGRLTWFPGDRVVTLGTLRCMLQNAYKADVVFSSVINIEGRSRLRNTISMVFSTIYIIAFGSPLRYIQATPVYSTELLRSIRVRSRRYSFPSETTVRLLRKGCTFYEMPGLMNPESTKSSALKLKNLWEMTCNFSMLLYDVYVGQRKEYSGKMVRVLPDEFK